jgi:transcriptional regulator with XRE-family HTH domain
MPVKFGQSIRGARRAAGLTQAQLGMRVGLKGRAISRWDRDDNTPTRRNRKALVTAINAVNQDAGAKLAAAIASDEPPTKTAAAVPAAQPIVPPISGAVLFEHAIFGMADELDLPPRRIRGALVRLLKRLGEQDVSLDMALRQLETWIMRAP